MSCGWEDVPCRGTDEVSVLAKERHGAATRVRSGHKLLLTRSVRCAVS
jgi:hypothetical protein